MKYNTTITVTPNIPLRMGERLVVKEPNGGRTVYTVRYPDDAHHDDTRTVIEFRDGKRVIREVTERSHWAAEVERFEPVWAVKERIRRALADEAMGGGKAGSGEVKRAA